MLDSGDYFGSSVASIGDLYADGAGDLAVGAYLDCRSGWNQGSNLTHVARRIRPDYFLEWIRNSRNFDPTTEMPSFEGTEDELQDGVEDLLTLE